VQRQFTPDRAQWIEKVQHALTLIEKKELEKVVLARICQLELEEIPDPFAIAAALQLKSQGAFLFCLQSEQEAFLGATPERLFVRTNKRTILTEAMAGTRPRGETPLQDRVLQKELMESGKDLREIQPVRTHLEAKLSLLCSNPPQSTPFTIHQTQNVQHLYSTSCGELKEGIDDFAIVKALHPTPALCGAPEEKAYRAILDLEPFERGLYGGTLGWTTDSSSEWIVAIRCCLIRGKQVTLFSGTGIVQGSNPEEEWAELDHKLKLYESIFTV
jgi:menaquinone-specific isochorismate synthase